MIPGMSSREGLANAWFPPTGESASASTDVTPAPHVVQAVPDSAAPPMTLPVDLPTLLRQLEDAYIRAALTQTRFNKKEAAKLLGMGRTTLVEKLRRRSLAANRTSS
jgi:sigma-54 specific flagellar transcriptional regulator A